MNTPTIKTVTDIALDAFWDVVAKQYPQAETGDLSPWTSIKLDIAAEAAVSEWVSNNVPQPPNQ